MLAFWRDGCYTGAISSIGAGIVALVAPRLWLIVAGAQERAAQTLTREFRADGQRAVLVAAPEMVRDYAAPDAVCVVVFSPDGPDPATLATALGLRFAGHLPVTTPDYGDPPAGPWAAEALSASVLNDALPTQLREQWARSALAEATQAAERALPEPPAAPLTKSQRKDRNLNRLSVFAAIFSIATILLAFVFGWLINKQFSTIHYQPPPTYPPGQAYRVHVPGTCDKNPLVE